MAFNPNGIRLPKYLVHSACGRANQYQVALLIVVIEAGDGDDRVWCEADREVVVPFDADCVRLPKDFMNLPAGRSNQDKVTLLIDVIHGGDGYDTACAKS